MRFEEEEARRGGEQVVVRGREGQERGAGVRDEEVVHVEELGQAGERRVALRGPAGGGVRPGAEGDFLRRGPGDDGACFVFALEEEGRRGGERAGGGVGGEGRGPDEL